MLNNNQINLIQSRQCLIILVSIFHTITGYVLPMLPIEPSLLTPE